jgi:hypothetical protein
MTEEDYEFISDKYGKLIWKAASTIGGDTARNVEDYVNDFWVVLLDYFNKYPKIKGCANIRDFCSKYDNYVKQWIWTLRNNIGGDNTKKLNFRKTHHNLDYFLISSNTDNAERVEDYGYGLSSFELGRLKEEISNKISIKDEDSLFIKDLEKRLDNVLNKIKLLIITDPDVLKSSSGNVNAMTISTKLNIPYSDTLIYLESIRQEYNIR